MRISILGSTGSIGVNSIDVIDNLNKNGFNIKISLLSANINSDKLTEQAKILKPEYVFLNDISRSNRLAETFKSMGIKLIGSYSDFINFVESADYDVLLNSLVGISGLLPTIHALKAGKRVALANKESLVVAGKIIKELIKNGKSKLLPIDSEHSAILQCLCGEDLNSIKKIILTASGGPFRNKRIEELDNVTVDEALKHPNWKMGKKITIDSATMMNKGLEVIEARWLFDMEPENIDVLIHPQSIIHSFVEFRDGSIKAQIGAPDMRIPIQYALTYPERIIGKYDTIDFSEINKLDFEQPDTVKFKCLKLSYDSLRFGGTYPVVLNAANEVSVKLFLEKKIRFTDIAEIIERELNSHVSREDFSVEDIILIDSAVKKNILKKH